MNEDPPRLRDCVAEEIAAACERQRAGQSFAEAGKALKRIVEARRRAMATEFARGDVAARRFAETIEEAITALFKAGAKVNPGAAHKCAVAAIGGFGRGMLAPYSDVDLVILHLGEAGPVKGLVDYILYPLYDAGLKVGHSVHTPSSAWDFAQKDLTARTAFLDARLIAGEEKIWRDFAQRYDSIRRRTKKQFVTAKNEEARKRHEKSAQSRFLAEPDLKEGKGGLRDLHRIRWLYKYEHGLDLDDPKAKKRVFSAEDMKAFEKAERFLWSVRVQLHALKGRAEEKLTFDLQPALAEKLGYADRAEMKAAERLMQRFFMNAMEIGRLTRLFSARLEEEGLKLSPASLKVIPKSLLKDEAGDQANLKLQNGRLHFQNVARARKTPQDLFRLFRAFSRRPDLDFHPDALAIVTESVGRLDSEAKDDPATGRLFLATLMEAKETMKLLRVMAETGLLGKYIPSFGKIIGRIEYGLYRRFSIDEQIYQSIAVLDEIASGKAKDTHPIASEILRKADSLAPFYVAVLLHETRWAVRRGEVGEVERLVARIARRLDLNEAQAERVAWCAARHLLMEETAERRNLADISAIARFAATVGDRARLDMALVLAVTHSRVVGIHSWDDWTRRQIATLYEGAAAFLEGGEARLAERMDARAVEARKAAAALLSDGSEKERHKALNALSDSLITNAKPEFIARLADMIRAAQDEGAKAGVSARQDEGAVEAIVYADDRPGLLADLAGAIAAAGASVRTVQVTTTTEGKAIDVFSIQSIDGAPIEDQDLVRRLHAKLLAVAEAPTAETPTFSRRIGDRRAMFAVPPRVAFDTDASATSLVVEAEGQDRPGLLHDLCAAFAEMKATIVSAHIATYGARAVDAFYLRDLHGRKIADGDQIKRIGERLLAALSNGEPARTPLTKRP